jgi:hypothetical protein
VDQLFFVDYFGNIQFCGNSPWNRWLQLRLVGLLSSVSCLVVVVRIPVRDGGRREDVRSCTGTSTKDTVSP